MAGLDDGVKMAGRKKSVLLRRRPVGRLRVTGLEPNDDLIHAWALFNARVAEKRDIVPEVGPTSVSSEPGDKGTSDSYKRGIAGAVRMGEGGRVEVGELHEEGEALFPDERAESKIERTSL